MMLLKMEVLQGILITCVSLPLLYQLLKWVTRRKTVAVVLNRHLNAKAVDLPIIQHRVSNIDRPNIDLAIKLLAASRGSNVRLVGYKTEYASSYDIRSLLSDGTFSKVMATAPGFKNLEVASGKRVQVLSNGLYLVSGDQPFAANIHEERFEGTYLEIIASDQLAASAILEEILALAKSENVYRGQVFSLQIEPGYRGNEEPTFRFHELPKVSREDIILPEETLALLERNTTSFFKNLPYFAKTGRSLKRGILLHGKPGTGKTFTAKWLAQTVPGLTTIILSGEQLYLIRECCRLARLLAPTLVILEDVDLITGKRETSADACSHVTLHQVLNEMDGMADNTAVMFLLTTNRPEIVEPAVAARPGRIDQAIEYPLPDQEGRRKLIELYLHGLDHKIQDWGSLVARTEGASPAFIQELVRKALTIAVDEAPENPVVTEKELDIALREMVLGGGQLTRDLLGFSHFN